METGEWFEGMFCWYIANVVLDGSWTGLEEVAKVITVISFWLGVNLVYQHSEDGACD